MIHWTVLLLTLVTSTIVRAAPTTPLNDAAILKNAQDAQKQNVAFQSLKDTDPCVGDEKACIEGAVAACQGGKWAVAQGKCSKSQACFALPSVREAGTLVTCTSEKNALAAFEAAGAPGGILGDDKGSEPSDSKESSCQGNGDSDAGCPAPTGNTSGNPNPSSISSATPQITTSAPPKSTPLTSSLPSTPSQTAKSPKPTASAPTETSELPEQETVTVTITLNGSTILPPTTRTLSPQEASSVLSSLMANGATIIEAAPTSTLDGVTTVPTSSPSSVVPSSGSSPTTVPTAARNTIVSSASPTKSATPPGGSVYY